MLVRARYTWQYYNKNYSFTYMRLHVLLYTGFCPGFVFASFQNEACHLYISFYTIGSCDVSFYKKILKKIALFGISCVMLLFFQTDR